MVDNALVTVPVLESRPDGLLRAVAAVRERFRRLARARRGDAGTLGDVVNVGSIVRVFAVDALREVTLIVAPSGWAGTTPGVVAADSPIGAALLGGRVGDTRRWGGPSGPRRLQVAGIVGRMPATAWEPTAERRAAPQSVHEAAAAPSREVAIRRPVALPLPAAA